MKKTVAVFFGSRSAEHDISIVTALSSVIKPLELTGKYNVVPVYISKEGSWYSDQALKDVNMYSSGRIDRWLSKNRPVLIKFDHGLTLIKLGIKSKSIVVDVAFPATHGTHGEDGDLMGFLEMANIPYVGCDVQASATAMDKVTSKLLAQTAGILVTNFVYINKHEYEVSSEEFYKKIEARLKYPLFVKPAHLGSSIAVTKVKNKEELDNAIELVFHYDDKVLVEEGVRNLIEVTQPIIGNTDLILANLEQPISTDGGVFNFDTKYLSGSNGKKNGPRSTKGAQGYSRLPAVLPGKLYEDAQKLAKDVYRILGCSGISRVDMLIDSKAGKVYFNEINPLPGSLYAHNWQSVGLSNTELVDRLIYLAETRHNSKSKYSTVFETNFLKQF